MKYEMKIKSQILCMECKSNTPSRYECFNVMIIESHKWEPNLKFERNNYPASQASSERI